MRILRNNIYLLVLACLLMILSGCSKEENKMIETKHIESKEFMPVFTSSQIPSDIYENMIGKSIPNKENVDISQLSYLKVTYYGFDDKPHIGDIIVDKSVSNEVLDIFEELYIKKYPIKKISLIDKYDAIDDLSMKDNNTSAFCYREIAGSNKLSNHSKGLAIDINPLINPMVKNGEVSPKEGIDYIDREQNVKGMITKGDTCYEAFTKRGWTWGGDWTSLKDYQHFEK